MEMESYLPIKICTYAKKIVPLHDFLCKAQYKVLIKFCFYQ